MEAIGTAMDGTTGVPKVIDPITCCLNNGHLYECDQSIVSLATNGLLLYEISTDGARYTRLISISVWSTEVYQTVELIEAPTLTTGSVVIPCINLNRVLTNVSKTVVKSNPTGISAGTLLSSFLIGGGSGVGQSKVSGSGMHPLGWILAPETTYLIRVTNKSANACVISTVLTFGEL